MIFVVLGAIKTDTASNESVKVLGRVFKKSLFVAGECDTCQVPSFAFTLAILVLTVALVDNLPSSSFSEEVFKGVALLGVLYHPRFSLVLSFGVYHRMFKRKLKKLNQKETHWHIDWDAHWRLLSISMIILKLSAVTFTT